MIVFVARSEVKQHVFLSRVCSTGKVLVSKEVSDRQILHHVHPNVGFRDEEARDGY